MRWAKGYDTHGPPGPWSVTADGIGHLDDPAACAAATS